MKRTKGSVVQYISLWLVVGLVAAGILLLTSPSVQARISLSQLQAQITALQTQVDAQEANKADQTQINALQTQITALEGRVMPWSKQQIGWRCTMPMATRLVSLSMD